MLRTYNFKKRAEKGVRIPTLSSPPSQSLELRSGFKLLLSRAEDLIIGASTSHKLKPRADPMLPNMKRADVVVVIQS